MAYLFVLCDIKDSPLRAVGCGFFIYKRKRWHEVVSCMVHRGLVARWQNTAVGVNITFKRTKSSQIFGNFSCSLKLLSRTVA